MRQLMLKITSGKLQRPTEFNIKNPTMSKYNQTAESQQTVSVTVLLMQFRK